MSEGLNTLAKGSKIQDATSATFANVVDTSEGASPFPIVSSAKNGLITASFLYGYNRDYDSWWSLRIDDDAHLIVEPGQSLATIEESNQPDEGIQIGAFDGSLWKGIKGTSNNELFVYSNLGKVGDAAIAVNTGALDNGTLRITVATDDTVATDLTDIKTAVEIIDDWDDGSDHCQVDIAAQTLTAVKVSKDANANATGNRLWVTSNVDQIGGSAVNVNGGAKDNGTQTVILATDDPAVTSLAVMDDWDSGDTCKTTKSAVGTYSPAATTGTAVAAVAAEVLASVEVLGYPNFSIWLKNAGGGGGGPLTDADIQVSFDGTEWVSLTWTTADSLTSGQTGVYSVAGNSYRYVKVLATAAAPANDTTCDCAITANTG